MTTGDTGWVGDFGPARARLATLGRELEVSGIGSPATRAIFIRSAAAAIARYKSRAGHPTTANERRAACRYLNAIKQGNPRRPEQALPPFFVQLLEDTIEELGSESSIDAILSDLVKPRPAGRSTPNLVVDLVRQVIAAYSRLVPGAAVSKNSKFARIVLPAVLTCAGCPTQSTARLVALAQQRAG